MAAALARTIPCDIDTTKPALEQLRAIAETIQTLPNDETLGPTLLRAFCHDEEALEDPNLRVPVVTVAKRDLSTVFSSELFAKQGHEIARELCAAQRQAETDLTDAIAMLTSLERIGAARHAAFHAIRRKPNARLLSPFLPHDTQSLLNEFLARVAAFESERLEQGAVDAFAAVESSGRALLTALNQTPTSYSRALDGFARSAMDFVATAYASCPAANPTQLSLSCGTRSYPLHLVGHVFTLPLLVENHGTGLAEGVVLRIAADNTVRLAEHDLNVGRVRAGVVERVELRIEVLKPTHSVTIVVQLSWQDSGRPVQETMHEFTVRAQRSDVNWSAIDRTGAYSLEPVESSSELVGRREMLSRLLSIVDSSRAGSAFILGQKRVGKTSLAKALTSELLARGYEVLYIESGDYVDPSPSRTLKALGARICRMIARAVPGLASAIPAEFGDSLSPLADLFDFAATAYPEKRFLIVLDEFDELPVELYERDSLGNSFFLTLRSLSSRSTLGLLLIGGEKANHILEKQADKLNKFTVVPVDYFSAERDWEDYVELVKRPTQGVLEFQHKALAAIFETTSGNPYFTHLLCQRLLSRAIELRDCEIAPEDVEHATRVLVADAARNSFQHFWEDGILETGRAASDRSVMRRRMLIAISDTLRGEQPASLSSIRKHPLAPANHEFLVREFSARRIIRDAGSSEAYSFTVPLFEKWLSHHGMSALLGTVEEYDALLIGRRAEGVKAVSLDEIRSVVQRWPNFRGQTVTEARAQAWLEQFREPRERRAMFAILQGLQFYSNSFVRNKMREVDGIVRHLTRGRVGGRALKSEELAITYLDGPGKSGAAMARLLCDERGTPADRIKERASLPDVLSAEQIRAVIMVDDFVGTGRSAADGLSALNSEVGDLLRSRDIPVAFVTVVGYDVGINHARTVANELRMGAHVHCCETITEQDAPFSPGSKLYSDEGDRDFAKRTAQDYGSALQRQAPLGFGGLGLAVVFERACPNNTLPILHAESTKPPWVPLFKRL